MGEDARLAAAKDRAGRFSGYYKCSLCNAEFRPELAITFALHVKSVHPDAKTSR
jgi:hypothetical protein